MEKEVFDAHDGTFYIWEMPNWWNYIETIFSCPFCSWLQTEGPVDPLVQFYLLTHAASVQAQFSKRNKQFTESSNREGEGKRRKISLVDYLIMKIIKSMYVCWVSSLDVMNLARFRLPW